MSLTKHKAPPYHNYVNKILIFITVNAWNDLNHLMIVLFHGAFCVVRIRHVRRLKLQSNFRPDCSLSFNLSVRTEQRQSHRIKLPRMFNWIFYKQFQYSLKCYRNAGHCLKLHIKLCINTISNFSWNIYGFDINIKAVSSRLLG